jgi:hypothetical protein
MTAEHEIEQKATTVAPDNTASQALLNDAQDMQLARGWFPIPIPLPIPVPAPYPYPTYPGAYCRPGEILVTNPYPYPHNECRPRF